jgi:MFS family permease
MLLNFGVLLPLYTRLGTKYLGSARNASFAIMIGSSLVLAAGAVMTGMSSTAPVFILGMVVYTAGEGLTVAINAYIATVIKKAYLARVMAMVSIAATSGKAIASAVFPQVLAIGLDTHIDELVGLPFLVASALFLMAGACVIIAGLSTRQRSEAAVIESIDEVD